jgi:uncharacterized protein YndB with AHSA1/START domain
MNDQRIDGARSQTALPVSLEVAFRTFTAGMTEWWPREYTWSQGALREIGIEPGVDGLCYERGPHGFRCDWGRVLAWEPPQRLTLAWHIGPTRVPQPNPQQASEVDVSFEVNGAGTRVSLLHHGFDRHGEGAADYRAAMDGPGGWDYILACFDRVCG